MLDLNAEPPIDWDEIEEWEGPAHDLAYDMVWTDEGIVHPLIDFL